MSAVTEARADPSRGRRAGAVVGQPRSRSCSAGSWRRARRSWVVVLSGFFEPVFYLLSMGIGLGALIGTVETTTGLEVSYAAFIAPALLAVSAMNGAIYDSTWNVFFKLNYGKLYEGMLSTSLGPLDVALGEILYALLRGLLYATGFMIIMQIAGLNLAWTAILAIPAVLLIAFGFASLGMAVTSYMKAFQQMDWINFVLLPMFLFSATLYPITVYPEFIQVIVKIFPLWHGVELVRGLTTGALYWGMLWHVLYYVVMIAVGLVFTTKRLRALFLD